MMFSWNLKHLFINGWFNWMIPNLDIGNGLFYETSIKNWLALEFQPVIDEKFQQSAADCKICLAYLRAFRGPHNGWNNPSVTTKKAVAAGSAWKCQTCTGIHSHQRNRLETYTVHMIFHDIILWHYHDQSSPTLTDRPVPHGRQLFRACTWYIWHVLTIPPQSMTG